ncbi:hypothetical protein OROGR_032070 [Orobanche gracilis]
MLSAKLSGALGSGRPGRLDLCRLNVHNNCRQCSDHRRPAVDTHRSATVGRDLSKRLDPLSVSTDQHQSAAVGSDRSLSASSDRVATKENER